MSRPIKFRVWDDSDKVMHPNAFNVDGYLFEDLIDVDDRFVLMQFTGLKDKGGKEIYEGDVVMQGNFGIENKGEKCPAEVYWNQNAWYVRTEKGHTGLHPLWIHSQEFGAEVIGNIYENPDLIKTGKP